MNRRLVVHLLGAILLIEGLAMVPSCLIALGHGDGDVYAFLITILLLAALGLPCWHFARPTEKNLRAREGFLVVALSWVLLSAFGALPFVLSGLIPNYVDALFEAVSGFTTTGATVLTQFDNLPRGAMFWRSFTHWIGGMGVLVLTLALLPQMTGRTSHLVRAESPGPSLSKIVPKMGDTAKILYLIYGVLTLIEFAVLIIAGMSPYDAAIHAMGTAGTGGFSNYGLSVGSFNSPLIDGIITFFMVLFGVNFALFYRVLIGGWRDALRSEELRWYLCLYVGSVLFISLMLLPQYGGFFTALRYGSFQVASIMSTTGYATADFNLWPQAVKALILILMFIGSCAGSTAGGIKVVRIALLCKLGRREIRHTFQPRKVQVVRFEGKGVEEKQLTQVAVFFFVYILLILAGMFLISLEGRFDMETNFTAALTCVSNVGPGMAHVGPMENFAAYGPFAKLVLSLLMLAGRLELFPILVLFHPSIWRRG
ncbi:MAG: TrkH family potassium uptake protein [Clostridiales bacterium]|nr:TrkH family potassium uptake protein [Clostridiales bacterium]MDO4350635.1 TrkH family potassium uptake protein [Eubacteriales bacterium]MDY4009868.1 TrkH family potassium uptake protein [Candidatus Limiplasma sp.]